MREEMADESKRNGERQRLAFPVLIETERGNIERCIGLNISDTGIFLECRRYFPIGSKLTVIFTPPSGSTEVRAKVTVVRAVELQPRNAEEFHLHIGLGLEFKSFDQSLQFNKINSLPI